ncbi:MAG: hypothetical protein ACFFC6_07420 [Promethearchaeota archaeon]
MSAKKAEIPIIEPAKSGRATCRGCREKILKGDYRVGIPYQFTRSDGETISSYGYYHPECTPKDKLEIVFEVLENSTLIGSVDKEKITEFLKQSQKKVESPQASSSPRKPFFELSKSSRGVCRVCEKKIEKGIFRVAEPTQVELDDGRKFFSHKFFHVECYLDTLSEVESIFQGLIQTSIKRKSISQEDADKLQKNLQEILSIDKTAAVVLSSISEEPIELETLKEIAEEEGVPFSIVKKALEKGMLNGIYFEPSPGKVQKL